MKKTQKILVVGATGGSGRATVQHLLRQGYDVTAFSRRASRLGQPADASGQLRTIDGDVTDAEAIHEAVRGHDAVIVTLGITENPFAVRLFGTRRTPMNVRSAGTRNVIDAMEAHGIRRLVVQSSYGVGATRNLLGFFDRLFFNLVLKPQIADTEVQEAEVRKSDVDWVLAQPVHLSDDDDDTAYLSENGETRVMSVARRAVGRFLAQAALTPNYIGKSVAISG